MEANAPPTKQGEASSLIECAAEDDWDFSDKRKACGKTREGGPKDAESDQKLKPKRATATWTNEDDAALLKAVQEEKKSRDISGDMDEDWDTIALHVPGKTAVQCLKRHMTLQCLNDKPAEKGVQLPASKAEDPPLEQEPPTKRVKQSTEQDGTFPWSEEDIELLRRLVENYENSAPRWNEIATNFPNHSAIDCLSKWQVITNPPVIKGKGSWTPEEDQILREKRLLLGRKWAQIAKFLPGRQGKQCRERYVNHLNPELKKGEWTDDEEAILISFHKQFGNRWANIAKQLPGRSDNDVKNHWYSTIQRKFDQHGEEKLVAAATQQVQMMGQIGGLPTQQQPAAPWSPTGPYNQATGSPGHNPPPMYPSYPPPPPPHFFHHGDIRQPPHHQQFVYPYPPPYGHPPPFQQHPPQRNEQEGNGLCAGGDTEQETKADRATEEGNRTGD